MKRLFCAIKLTANEKLKALMESFRSRLHNERINWVDPENLHITLKFFGDTPGKTEGDIITALREAASGISAFSLRLSGFGTFGNRQMPKVIWVAAESGGRLEGLYDAINNNIGPLGYHPDRKHFVPHLTIGRIKHINRQDTLENLIEQHRDSETGELFVSSFYLFQSILRPEGPLYIIRKEFQLPEV